MPNAPEIALQAKYEALCARVTEREAQLTRERENINKVIRHLGLSISHARAEDGTLKVQLIYDHIQTLCR